MTFEWSRRSFLKATGAVAIGFSWDLTQAQPGEDEPEAPELPGSLQDSPRIDSWLEISADGSVRVFTGKLELGQGIAIAVAQVAAEELGVDISRVSVVLADTALTPNEGYTAGSQSIETSAMAVRYAAASARERILKLAAGRLQLQVEDLELEGNKVVARSDQRSIELAQLLSGAGLHAEVRLPVKLKPPAQYRYVGKSVGRKELRAMVAGEELYLSDLRFPDMLHARVVRPSSYGAKLLSCDVDSVKGMPGQPKVVRDGSFLAVTAEGEWACMKAAEVLRSTCRWGPGRPLAGSSDLRTWMAKAPVSTQKVQHQGSPTSESTLTAVYSKPYTMHASVGPSCAVALFDHEKLTVWSHTQGVFPLRGAIGSLLGLEEAKVRVIGALGPGCYGHNGADDVAADAALIARAVPGRHVRLQWSRADEHRWEPYGSAMMITLSARLDEHGDIAQWTGDIRSDTHSTRPGGDASKLLAAGELEKPLAKKGGGYSAGSYRNSQPIYRIPNRRIDFHAFQGPLRVSALRSLGAFANVFALESFMDELAQQAKRDPFEFRIAHLDDPRGVAVMERLREVVGKRADEVGIAFARYKNQASYCAVAALVGESEGSVRVEQLWGVVEAGEIINPDGLANQIEGGMIQAASWTVQEAVRFGPEGVASQDWESYPIFRFQQVPRTEVHLISRPDLPPLGAGETAQGPTAAAIANGLFRATGHRARDLPLRARPV